MTHFVADTSERTTYCGQRRHEPPVKRRVERPADEKLAALLKVARKAGVAGAALLDAAADELGIEKEDL